MVSSMGGSFSLNEIEGEGGGERERERERERGGGEGLFGNIAIVMKLPPHFYSK